MTALPQHFTVTATVNSTAADGTLTIAPGAIVLRLAPDARRVVGVGRVTHGRPELTMLTARLRPPFSNTRLYVEEDELVAIATLPGWSRARLRDSVARCRLRAARAGGLAHDPRSHRPLTATDARAERASPRAGSPVAGARITEVRSAACGWPVRARS